MNTLNTLGSNPRIMLIVGIVVGLIIGMIVFWGVLPPKAVDVPPALLQSGYRDFYLAYVANEYSTTHDLDTVKTKLGADKDGYPSKQIAADLRKLAQSPSANKAQLEALAYDISGHGCRSNACDCRPEHAARRRGLFGLVDSDRCRRRVLAAAPAGRLAL